MTPEDFAVKTADCPCRQNAVISRCSCHGEECKKEDCPVLFVIKAVCPTSMIVAD